MYVQVCSNSAYPQHSGERYRTNGPVVLLAITLFQDSFTCAYFSFSFGNSNDEQDSCWTIS